MKKSLIILASTLVFVSCQRVDLSDFDSSDARYTINTTITNQDMWSQATRSAIWSARRAEARPSDQLIYMTYIFNSEGKALTNRGRYMTAEYAAENYPLIFSTITSAGTYKLYSIMNIASGEYLSTTATPATVITPDSTFTLDTLYAANDVCLGTNELTVTASQLSYNVNVEVNHIMSKLALTIKGVPADVTTMKVTLPKQSYKFNFKGEFSQKDSVSQTITLAKASSANADGSYDWTCSPTIIFPCATGTTSMPITIHWESTDNVKDVKTTSSYCCLSGKNLELETTWNENFRASTTTTINPWAGVEKGTFDWNP